MSLSEHQSELVHFLPPVALTIGDGYDWQARVERVTGWRMIPSWGRDGWDLGDWPYVQYGSVDVAPDASGLVVYGYLAYCEGDTTIKAYADRADREAALDESALFHWKHSERLRNLLLEPLRVVREGKPVADLTVDDLPDRLRGRFSWARLDREKPLTGAGS